MDKDRYIKILKEGERVDWHGEMVPKELITPGVRFWCDMVIPEINKLESTMNEYRGTNKEKRQGYIDALWNNVRNAPYTLNGDLYLIKKKRIEEEMKPKEEKKKRKTTRRTKKVTKANNNTLKKTTKDASSPSKTTATKNSNLIFGKNKK
jgi:hypothetical protein